MTNFEATAYARVALLNLKKYKIEITPDNLFLEMHYLFDLFDEKSIVNELDLRT